MGIAIYSGIVTAITEKEIIINVPGCGKDCIPRECVTNIENTPSSFNDSYLIGKALGIYYHYGDYELKILGSDEYILSEEEKIQQLIITKAYLNEKGKK